MEPHLVEGSLVAPFFQHWLSRVIFKLFASRHDESRQIFLVWCSLVFSGNVCDISGLCQNFRIYILLMWHLSSIQIPCTNELSSFFLPESDGKTQTNTQTISSPNLPKPYLSFQQSEFPCGSASTSFAQSLTSKFCDSLGVVVWRNHWSKNAFCKG